MKWTIDPAHSSVEFAVRHMGISTIRGRFKHVHGTLEATADCRPSKRLSRPVASIRTSPSATPTCFLRISSMPRTIVR